VRIEYSEKYGYLYFFFPTGRVIGIPCNTPTEEALIEGMDCLCDAVVSSQNVEKWGES
jgi:hypothetical protein